MLKPRKKFYYEANWSEKTQEKKKRITIYFYFYVMSGRRKVSCGYVFIDSCQSESENRDFKYKDEFKEVIYATEVRVETDRVPTRAWWLETRFVDQFPRIVSSILTKCPTTVVLDPANLSLVIIHITENLP